MNRDNRRGRIPWIDDELSLTRRMLEGGHSLEEISEVLQSRTPGAVGYKAVAFGFMTERELRQWYSRTSSVRRRGQARFRKDVLKRDGQRCVVCGAKRDLHAHHVIPHSKVRKHEVALGITLCETCHRVAEVRRSPRITRPERRRRWKKYIRILRQRGFRVESEFCAECHRTHLNVSARHSD